MMPYEGPDDAGLPDRIKKMSKDSREKWVKVWNSAFENCRDKDTVGGAGSVSDCEGTAFRFANAAVKETSEKALKDWAIEAYRRQAPQEVAEYNATGGGSQKACANCMFFASPNMCTTVESYPLAISPTGICGYWTGIPDYRPEPMEVVIVEEGTSETKQVTKTEDGTEFRASDYAVVPDPELPSTWKLRLAESKSGDFTVAQVARAITAMQPGGFRGQRVELSADEKKQAISRISAAIGKTGGDDTQKENLRERLDKVKEKNIIEKVVNKIKGLFESQEAMGLSGWKFYKQSDGRFRWVAWVTNKYRDEDNPPEIFEDKAHREFVSYLDAGGKMPDTWLWHTPGTDWGQADWVDYANGFLVMSGLVKEGAEPVAEALSKMRDLKVSHGYKYRYSDEPKKIIGWYRTFEISPLPAEAAANPWTGMELVKQEVNEMFSDKKREFLVGVLGEDSVVSLEGKTEQMAKTLDDLGIEYKEAGQEGDAPDVFAELIQKAANTPSPEQVAQAVVDSEGFKAMAGIMTEVKEQIPSILARLKELEKSEDEKVAAVLIAKTKPATQGFRATESAKTVITETEDEKKKASPGLPDDWPDMFKSLALGRNSEGARAS